MRVYLSGPITGIDNYKENFAEAKLQLEMDGHEVVNPCDLKACLVRACKGEVVKTGNVTEWVHSWECYLRYDLKAMLECDGIYMLKGWSVSQGARLEYHVATSVGIHVLAESEIS